jgi:hypothetical protein
MDVRTVHVKRYEHGNEDWHGPLEGTRPFLLWLGRCLGRWLRGRFSIRWFSARHGSILVNSHPQAKRFLCTSTCSKPIGRRTCKRCEKLLAVFLPRYYDAPALAQTPEFLPASEGFTYPLLGEGRYTRSRSQVAGFFLFAVPCDMNCPVLESRLTTIGVCFNFLSFLS